MLRVEHVYKSYRNAGWMSGRLQVLKGISFAIEQGETIALVGESGSGKSTLALLILGLEDPDSGTLLWNGRKLTQYGKHKKTLYREIQPVFQDHTGCLNPRMKIFNSLMEPLCNYENISLAHRTAMAQKLLRMVDLPQEILDWYPHQLSGGQQKRVCIARAISVEPKFIVLDEALAGLDATVTLKILRILKRIQKEIQCSYLFITHDRKAARFLTHNTIALQNGRILEKQEDTREPLEEHRSNID